MGLPRDVQARKLPVSFSFPAPIYQAWEEIPPVVLEDLSCALGPFRLEAVLHCSERWRSGLRAPRALLKAALQSPWSPVAVAALCRRGAASGYSYSLPLSNPGQHHALPGSSTFAETMTPVPPYPGTVRSPSSSQDTNPTPPSPPRPPSLLPLPKPHGPKLLSCVSVELGCIGSALHTQKVASFPGCAGRRKKEDAFLFLWESRASGN